MSFVSKIKVDGEEMNVLHCSFHFSQAIDATGKPNAVPQGGTVDVLLESNGATNLFDWMISPTQVKSGTVTFYRRDSMSKLKTLEFTDAHCINYHETFNHNGDHPMQIQLTFSARELKLNGSSFVNNWPQH